MMNQDMFRVWMTSVLCLFGTRYCLKHPIREWGAYQTKKGDGRQDIKVLYQLILLIIGTTRLCYCSCLEGAF